MTTPPPCEVCANLSMFVYHGVKPRCMNHSLSQSEVETLDYFVREALSSL